MEKGKIIVFHGPMFAGKTLRGLQRLQDEQLARQAPGACRCGGGQVFKWTGDDRCRLGFVRCHNGGRRRATMVGSAGEILTRIRPGTAVIMVDEAQFFGQDIIDLALHLSDQGITGIYTMLNRDWRGATFGVDHLVLMADESYQCRAVCAVCGKVDAATRSQRLTGDTQQIVIGGRREYRPVCRQCFDPQAFGAER